MTKKYQTICLIPAAGSGVRTGNSIPKQYRLLGGVPMLRRTVLAFLHHPRIDAVCVAYNPEHQMLYDLAVGDLDILPPVVGGAERQDSVRLGLEALQNIAPKHVLIHDAARPLVSAVVISQVLDAVEIHGAAIPALAVEDTLKSCQNDSIINTVDRQSLMRAQTPQGFIFNDILAAHQQVKGKAVTDDASIYEQFGKKVHVTPGSQWNFKVTSAEDLAHAEKLIGSGSADIRVGTGFDVHAFCPPKSPANNAIMINGVAVPHAYSLDGHSDADVGLHALVDALLGCVHGKDIGFHFPPSNNTFKGMDSSVFVKEALRLVQEANGQILSVDLTIICQAPKIGPHREAMQQRIADILGIDVMRVNVKATTTEGLGFTGRKEGIAAQAVASVRISGQ